MTRVSAPLSSTDSNDRTDLFDFDLPRDLIADAPANPRDSSRMLEIADQLTDRAMADFPASLRAGDVGKSVV